MSRHPDLDRIADHVFGLVSDEEISEVGTHVAGCEECARRARELKGEGVRLEDALLAAPPPGLAGRILDAESKTATPERRRAVWASRLSVAAAATIFFAVLGTLFFRTGFPAEKNFQVISGPVEIRVVSAPGIPAGARALVTGSEPAEILLEEGTRLVLAPRSEVLLGLRVELRRGAARVRGGRGTLELVTPIGTITAQGAEFSVELREAERKGERRMEALMAMVVAVLSGNARVEDGGKFASVSAGETVVCFAGGSIEIAAQDKDDGEKGQKGKNEKGKNNDKDDDEKGQKGKNEKGKKNDKDEKEDDGGKEKGKKKKDKGEKED